MATPIKRLLCLIGIVLCLSAGLLLLANQYPSLMSLNPKYRITTSALCLICALATSLISPRAGLIGVMFALPLQPKLAWQIQQYFGYGRILGVHNAGLDLAVGFCLGTMLNHLWRKRGWRDFISMPWPVALASVLVTASTIVAISRNLAQSATLFRSDVLIYNLMHLRSLDWHDDYRPLFDWAVYGCAFLFIATLIPVLRKFKGREHYLFLPLVAGLVIAAIVGIRQSKYGIGFTAVQMLFRSEHFGFMALGFQDDIHAFAGQMMIGAVGLWGYFYAVKNLPLRLALAVGVIPLFWVALFLSKSKASFALAVLASLLLVVIWFTRHRRYFWQVTLSLSAGLLMFLLCGLFFSEAWVNMLAHGIQLAGVKDLGAFNLALSYRPEVYVAGLKMFALFPIFGMGQGEYYRQAANHDLTQSFFLSIQQNGENGHNYFLQTLVETGIIGGIVFSLLLLYPVFNAQNRRALIPGGVALGSVFIANIFAHSLLVRENLLISASLLALMYVYVDAANPLHSSALSNANEFASHNPRDKSFKPLVQVAIWIASLLLIIAAIAEVTRATTSFPFTVDTQCYKPRPIDRDGWTTGLVKLPIPPDAKQLNIALKPHQLLLDQHPVKVEISVFDAQSNLLTTQLEQLTNTSPKQLEIVIPASENSDHEAKTVVLRLSRCFIPRNLLINEDSRRLGLQIDSVNFD